MSTVSLKQQLSAWLLLLLLPVAMAQTEEQAVFALVDAELNGLWSQVQAVIQDDVYAEQQLGQWQWLAYRDWYATASTGIVEGVTDEELHESPHYWEQLSLATSQRIEYLKAWLNTHELDGVFDPVHSGVWVDGYGGRLSLSLAEDGESFDFEISVVRGPTWHSGDIAGQIVFGPQTARYTEELPTDEVLHLTFIRRGALIEIIGENTNWYHGARAYFDGTYAWLGETGDSD